MPIVQTRSTPRQTTLCTSTPNLHKRKLATATTTTTMEHQDVIELSSDDECPPARKRPTPKCKIAPISAAAGSRDYEIVEVSNSSDDDASSKPTASNAHAVSDVASLTKRNKKLQQDNDRMKVQLYGMRKNMGKMDRELGVARRELSQTKAKLSEASTKNLGSLEEEVTCEICALKMWSPYLLSECGHVFCQGCLTGWLSSTRMQHVNNHPSYIPLPTHLQRALHDPTVDPNAFLHAHIFLTQHPPPKYTCPTCRMPVTRKPVEDFALKKIVSWVASVQHEEIPKRTLPMSGGRKCGPWDLFFCP